MEQIHTLYSQGRHFIILCSGAKVPKSDVNTVTIESEYSQNTVEIQLKYSQNTVKYYALSKWRP